MAVAARQVRVAAGEDHLVAVQTETIFDPETGVAAQVEKTLIAVDRGDGTVAVQERQRIVGAVVAPPRQSRPAIGYSSIPNNRQYQEKKEINHCFHFIVCLICPCWIFCWILACCAE